MDSPRALASLHDEMASPHHSELVEAYREKISSMEKRRTQPDFEDHEAALAHQHAGEEAARRQNERPPVLEKTVMAGTTQPQLVKKTPLHLKQPAQCNF
ncbi:hypothetical protein AeRB84_003836 [Aphanomyces euteiches]|nr:hypothetical protein AeRB84_009231 [Aphanomyces euteiches]KAH9154012.1 hypothetical protein AeRB84_003836 [Aphanomyces euteiches]